MKSSTPSGNKPEGAALKVKVRLYATLSRYHPQGKGTQAFTVKVSAEDTVARLIEQLGLEKDAVKLIFVRHKARTPGYRLQDGDEVAIFPPVAGG